MVQRHFVGRPQIVQAQQWDGTNSSDVCALIAGDLSPAWHIASDDGQLLQLADDNGSLMEFHIGDWAHAGSVYTDAAWNATYQEVTVSSPLSYTVTGQ